MKDWPLSMWVMLIALILQAALLVYEWHLL